MKSRNPKERNPKERNLSHSSSYAMIHLIFIAITGFILVLATHGMLQGL